MHPIIEQFKETFKDEIEDYYEEIKLNPNEEDNDSDISDLSIRDNESDINDDIFDEEATVSENEDIIEGFESSQTKKRVLLKDLKLSR